MYLSERQHHVIGKQQPQFGGSDVNLFLILTFLSISCVSYLIALSFNFLPRREEWWSGWMWKCMVYKYYRVHTIECTLKVSFSLKQENPCQCLLSAILERSSPHWNTGSHIWNAVCQSWKKKCCFPFKCLWLHLWAFESSVTSSTITTDEE